MPAEKLYVTIFQGEGGVPRDREAYEYWLKAGVVPERIFELGMKENFWQMGDTGPCGPCSELHYDMGIASSDRKLPECAAGECKFPCECGRYVEIWNLVFMQFDRSSDGVLNPLPKPSIDTGAGLERVTAVMQGVVSNYDTDLFVPLIEKAAELVHFPVPLFSSFSAGPMPPPMPSVDVIQRIQDSKLGKEPSLRVIADHSRAATFLISDGVLPANEGRGYVLRKIIRRAIRHGRLLGQTQPFLYKMVEAVVKEMIEAYPELGESASRVAKVIEAEEIRFAHTLSIGSGKLDDLISSALEKLYSEINKLTEADVAINNIWIATKLDFENSFTQNDHIKLFLEAYRAQSQRSAELDRILANPVTLNGAEAFRLYDTFGLPLDFMTDAARDQGVSFDHAGFNAAMDEQRTIARASWKGGSQKSASPVFAALPQTIFEGYRQEQSSNCEVLAIVVNGQGVQQLLPGQQAELVLDHTPFYAESGGQVGDKGWLYSADRTVVVAEVEGVHSPVQGVRAHNVTARQPITVGEKLIAVVDSELRSATRRHHTATHLLHAALRQVLGTHVKQAGSLVSPDYLRFDFSHFASLADEELQEIEDIANRQVLFNNRVQTVEDVPIDVAVNEYHAMALFGEKYGEKVRVLKIADFSTELCGGTHVSATGEIGLIKILKEGSVSSGVRRIEAVAGEQSLRHFRRDHELEGMVSTLVGRSELSPAEALKQELDRREEELKKLRKELDQVRMKSAASAVASADENVKEVKGVKVLAHRADHLDRSQLRTLVDNFRNKIGSGVVIVGSVTEGKVAVVVGVTKDLTARLQAGKIVGLVAQKVGGSGGGRPDLAEAGGKNPDALDQALRESYATVEALLG
jgi:alanyl-tRNA synthetase